MTQFKALGVPTHSRVAMALITSMAEVAPTKFTDSLRATLETRQPMAYLAGRETTAFMAGKRTISCAVMAISKASKFQTILAMITFMEITAMT